MARRRKKPSKLRRWLRGIAFALLAFIVLSFAIVLPLNWVDPKTTAFMLQDDGESVAQEWVDWEDLGTALPLAVVAEDLAGGADPAGDGRVGDDPPAPHLFDQFVG